MQRYTQSLVISGFLLFGAPVFAAPPPSSSPTSSPAMKPFPPAEQGFKRMVIHLQPLAHEDANKFEIIIGKPLKIDCNRHWFIGHLSEEAVRGWGVTYFSLKLVTGPTSTLYACPAGQQEHDAFVPVQSDEGLLPYNSKLPVVVYVPNEFEVRYRVWTAKEDLGEARSGRDWK